MSDFVNQYVMLLIKQYWEKPKAQAEIRATVEQFEPIFGLLKSFDDAFDVDKATDAQLDLIGRIVGITRVVNVAVSALRFGFAENGGSGDYGDKFNPSLNVSPMRDKFSQAYTQQELDNVRYRRFIKAKVMKNSVSCYLVNDTHITIQDVITAAFDGKAYVVDNQDMTLTLYIANSVSQDEIDLIRQLGLLPTPISVRYKDIVYVDIQGMFGFSSNPDALGFGDTFDETVRGGVFAWR